MEPDARTYEPEILWRYLLGELTEGEQERLEEELFEQEEYIADLAVAEDDLIDAYVAGELSGRQRERFESFFLSSPRRKQRLAAAQALAASRQVHRVPVERKGLQVVGGRSLSRALGRWIAPLAAAAAVVLVAGGAFVAVQTLRSQSEAQIASLHRQVKRFEAELQSRPAPPPSVDREALLAELRKELAPPAPLDFLVPPAETRRDANRPEPTLLVPSAGQWVQLSLTLSADPAARKYTGYRVVVQTGSGAQVWGGEARLSRGALALTLPAGVLKPGEYRAEVNGVTASGAVEELDDYYLFRVVSR